MLIRQKAKGSKDLQFLEIPKNLESGLIQKLLPLAHKAKQLIGMIRVQEVKLVVVLALKSGKDHVISSFIGW